MPYFGGEGGSEGVGFRLQASVSYTGTWQFPYFYLISPPDNGQLNDTGLGPIWGSWIEAFSYVETVGSLLTLTFNDLIGVKGTFAPTLLSATSLSAPLLQFAGGTFSVTYSPLITTLNFPLLSVISGVVGFTGNTSLTSLSLPNLQYILTGSGMGTLTNPALVTWNFPSLIVCYGQILAQTGNGNITNATLGAVGTTKFINGNINFAGQKLTQASVDQILHTIASLDGTGGTTSWGTGRTLTLNGGTNSTPSATGLADKAIIVARGATVLNN